MDKDGGASTKLATYHGNGGGSMNGGLAVLNETTAFFGADQGTFPPCDAGIVEITLSSSSASEPFPFNCNTGPFPRRLALVGSSLLALSDQSTPFLKTVSLATAQVMSDVTIPSRTGGIT